MEKTYQSKKFRKEVPTLLLMATIGGLSSWVAFSKSIRDGLLLLACSLIGFGWMWVTAGKLAKSIVVQNGQIKATLGNGKVKLFDCGAVKAINSLQRIGYEESVVTFVDGGILRFTSYFYEYDELKKFFNVVTSR